MQKSERSHAAVMGGGFKSVQYKLKELPQNETAPLFFIYRFIRIISFLTFIGIPTLPTTDLLRRVIRHHIASIAVPLEFGTDI